MGPVRAAVAIGIGEIDRAESQRIGDGDDLRAHAENVAHDAADAGGGALEGDDLRRMIVRLVRDDDGIALAVVRAQVQHSGVFARSEDDAGAARRQRLQKVAARFIAAMLAPRGFERVQLDDGGIAAQALGDAL